ncbi:YceK/YidQ family lipoprotein [Pseudomonas sp. S09G 359]|uniref:YceK/YidQ family lipoprotein n=1 Tax=Pseudomonas sp. S09G 359 TaxID=2054919 RepID=UPI0012FF59E6|nr:YceK/YidQ family lipoprotein [Pseudomonas sp. S09G 359]
MINSKCGLLGLVFTVLTGCGSLGAAIMNGPLCPYQGVHLDFNAITDWQTILITKGFIIPLAIIDLPLSFVVDTFSLGAALEADNGNAHCPRDYS